MQVRISILVLLFCSSAMAVTPKKVSKVQRKVSSIECNFVKWPYADKAIGKEQIQILLKLDRGVVRSYYFNEITATPVQKELAHGLYDFLISSEPNENIRSFLELTAFGADLKTTTPKAIDKKELCDLAKRIQVELPQN